MANAKLFHALGLHMHQPPGNLRLLIETNPQEAEQIIRCYERVPRYVRKFEDQARIHVAFSGILLEQFRDPDIVNSYRDMIDIPAMLDSYARTEGIEVVGMGYDHPIFPSIPPEDWQNHLIRGREIINDTFGRAPRGFWPSELAFCMDMIPALVKSGYEYVIVDGASVQRQGETADIHRLYRATVNGASIIVVPRDPELSNAQAEGTNPRSFFSTIQRQMQRAAPTERYRLITTWSDGENGGWFRQMHEQSGFFGHFFTPFMEEIRTSAIDVRPIFLSDFVAENPPVEEVDVSAGSRAPGMAVDGNR